MKFTTLLLIISIMQVSANGFAQKITLSKTDAPLIEVLSQIRSQSGYGFIFNSSALKDANRVTIDVRNVELKEVLDQIFKDQSLTYSFEDKSVVIRKKTPSLLDRLVERWAAIDVRGRVVDSETGSALAGATVKVKGTNKQTSTNGNGEFVLRGVDEGTIIVVSFVGYQPMELKAAKDMETIKLIVSDRVLDQVQVIAYGTTSRRLNTGVVSSVKSEVIEKQPVYNPLLAMAGRIPGVLITQSTGFSGSGVSVQIQGINSIASGTSPFYVIDGVPYSANLIRSVNVGVLGQSTDSGDGQQGPGNPFSFINPSDIESIEVLRDADATAIYGSRAANGAILITTKKGKQGITKVNLTIQQGIGKVGHFLELLSTQQYLEMRKEAYRNDGFTVPIHGVNPNTSNYDLTVWDSTRYTDWQKELIGGTAQYSDFQLGFSGGNSQTTFRLNGGYHRETTVFPSDLYNAKGSFGFNLNHQSENKRFNMQFSGNYLHDRNKLPISDLTSVAVLLAPNAPALYKDDEINWEVIPSGNTVRSTWVNPMTAFVGEFNTRTNNLISNLLMKYKFFSGLDLSASFGYTNLSQNEIQTVPLQFYSPQTRPTITSSANYSNGGISSWIIEPYVRYSRTIAKGNLEILVGTSFQQKKTENTLMTGSGYVSDLLLGDIASASTITINANPYNQYKYAALFGRVNYNWEGKYILNLTARRDGSSRFGSENQFHTFAAAGAAWVFSKEDFVKEQLGILSHGKLRSSYGVTGNDQIGDYLFMDLHSSPVGIANAYQGISALLPSRLENPYFQWEIVKKTQAGIDLGFFNDRILLNTNYYVNMSSNQLLSYNLPVMTGFTSILRNFPAKVENRGWEFELNTINLQQPDFKWSSNFNLTLPKNRLVSFPTLSNSSYANTLIIGEPIGILRKYNFAGVSPETGVYQFHNVDNTITSVPNSLTDRYMFYDSLPKYFGGFSNSFSYKKINLDFLFQFVKQKGKNYVIGNLPGFHGLNQPISVLDRWQKPGDETNIQRYSTILSIGNANNSNFGISDASFVRLKNVSISWNIPQRWIDRAKLSDCRIFAQGQNLWTMTRYDGLDPESRSVNTLPPLRVFTFGLQVGI